MSVQEFARIVPYLPHVENVVLEGWGESTLHPSLAEIAGLARAAGPRVGFVTNGTSLRGEALTALLEGGIDFMGFSLHGPLRRGPSDPGPSDFETLCETIRLVQEHKKRARSDLPDLRLVFMLLSDNLHEAPLVVRAAAGLGVKRVAFIHLIHIAGPRQERLRAFRYEEEKDGGGPALEASLREASESAKALGVALSLPDTVAHEVAVCEENPLATLFISADGDVFPCVFLAPPLPSPFRRIFRGEERFLRREPFGNILREPLEPIWEGSGYREFRERFLRRRRTVNELYESLLRSAPPPAGPLPPPPPSCASCHKLLGL